MKQKKSQTIYLSNKQKRAKIILDHVLFLHDFTSQEAFQKSRKRPLVMARYEAWFMIRKFVPRMGLAAIGCLAKPLYNIDLKFDHATVLHGTKVIQDICDVDLLYNHNLEITANEVKKLLKEYDIKEKGNDLFNYELKTLVDTLQENCELKEIELLSMYLRKHRNERFDTDQQENIELEMVQGHQY